jgi:hypothetical protein
VNSILKTVLNYAYGLTKIAVRHTPHLAETGALAAQRKLISRVTHSYSRVFFSSRGHQPGAVPVA